MPLKKRFEFLFYTVALLILVSIDFFQLTDYFEDSESFRFGGVVLYLLFVVTIARDKWKYYGLIAAFMVWTGLFCVIGSLLSIFDPETTTYETTFNILYALFGVFGGIRIYSAWLRYARNQEEQASGGTENGTPER